MVKKTTTKKKQSQGVLVRTPRPLSCGIMNDTSVLLVRSTLMPKQCTTQRRSLGIDEGAPDNNSQQLKSDEPPPDEARDCEAPPLSQDVSDNGNSVVVDSTNSRTVEETERRSGGVVQDDTKKQNNNVQEAEPLLTAECIVNVPSSDCGADEHIELLLATEDLDLHQKQQQRERKNSWSRNKAAIETHHRHHHHHVSSASRSSPLPTPLPDAPTTPRPTSSVLVSSEEIVAIVAPPGKLGVGLSSRVVHNDNETEKNSSSMSLWKKKPKMETYISSVASWSALSSKVQMGDRILELNGRDVRAMGVAELKALASSQNHVGKMLVVQKTVHVPRSAAAVVEMEKVQPPDQHDGNDNDESNDEDDDDGKKDKKREIIVGDVVATPYGSGQVIKHRFTDDMFVIELLGMMGGGRKAMLYAPRDGIESYESLLLMGKQRLISPPYCYPSPQTPPTTSKKEGKETSFGGIKKLFGKKKKKKKKEGELATASDDDCTANTSISGTCVTVTAPPGTLGIKLVTYDREENGSESVVSHVDPTSVVSGKISPGDRLLEVNDQDVSAMTLPEVKALVASQRDVEKKLLVLKRSRSAAASPASSAPVAAGPSDDQHDEFNNEEEQSTVTDQEDKESFRVEVTVGEVVWTSYGDGKVVAHRKDDDMYVISLVGLGATLYAKREAFVRSQSMALNVAFEALEQMRKLNLEIECGECGVSPVDFTQCTKCLLSGAGHHPTSKDGKKRSKKAFPRISKLLDERKKSHAPPCLICGHPTCNDHGSSSFRQEKLTVCLECANLFSLEFIIDCVSEDKASDRERNIDHMVNAYDRSLLVLRYSAQYIDHIASALEHNTQRNNKIGLGSNTAGLVSGTLGIAAAATIFTPAGPPLLIASLLFGGTATAASTGSEAINYFSEPNKLADKIIALHSLVMSILRVTNTLRDALLRDHIHTDNYQKREKTKAEQIQDVADMTRLPMASASSVTSYAIASSEIATATNIGLKAASKNTRFFTRGATAAMRTVRFARFAGGALSAATLVFEAKDMHSTIQRINAGNPCEKANLLRSIRHDLLLGNSEFPDTASLDMECKNYLGALANRRWNEEVALKAMLEVEARLVSPDGVGRGNEEDGGGGGGVLVEQAEKADANGGDNSAPVTRNAVDSVSKGINFINPR